MVKGKGDRGISVKVKVKGREGKEDSTINLKDGAALVVGMLLSGKQVTVERGDVEDISEAYKRTIDIYDDVTTALDRNGGAVSNMNMLAVRVCPRTEVLKQRLVIHHVVSSATVDNKSIGQDVKRTSCRAKTSTDFIVKVGMKLG